MLIDSNGPCTAHDPGSENSAGRRPAAQALAPRTPPRLLYILFATAVGTFANIRSFILEAAVRCDDPVGFSSVGTLITVQASEPVKAQQVHCACATRQN